MISPLWVPVVGTVCGTMMIPITVIGTILARAHSKRVAAASTTASLPPDVALRLERMEQAIDSIAVEVERISEGQRFTTRLLASRTEGVAPVAEIPDALRS